MEERLSVRKQAGLLVCGLLGCLLMAAGDWLMIYGDTAFTGKLAWLTAGAAEIAPWRNGLALMLSFPAVLLYCVALMGIKGFFRDQRDKNSYGFLTALGMTPWLCLHLFYIMILFLFGWMNRNGHGALAHAACEALFDQFFWLVFAGEALMLLPFAALFVQILRKKTVFSRWMAVNNPLVFYLLLKAITLLLPDTPFRLAFTNGLMSEAMVLFFAVLFLGGMVQEKKRRW